ncbi:MAG: tetratricopeptide repeat protein [Bacteroides sp.]
MRNLKYFFLLGALLLSVGVFAQPVVLEESVVNRYERAMALYRARNYGAAAEEFKAITTLDSQESGVLGVEAAFFSAACVARLGRKDAVYELHHFIETYPTSLRLDEARNEVGLFYYNSKRYKEALSWFGAIEVGALDQEQRAELNFRRGYALFMLDRLDEAYSTFAQVKERTSYYQAPATYYYAHIAYTRGNYSAALDNFERIDTDPSFAPVVPYYIAQIYYKQEQYRKLVNYVAPMLETATSSRQAELQRMLGEGYFRLGINDSAALVLGKYVALVGKGALTRDDNYLLGLVNYRQKKWRDAISYLERVPTVEDSVAQNANYHLGDCYLQTGDTERAQKALGLASEQTFDKVVQEDALFNYAKLLYEHRYNPFSDAVSAFSRYIALFPHSKRMDDAYTYLGMSFMATQNYQGALDALSRIGTENATMRRAFQRASYYRGVECFQGLNFEKADSLFAKSLAYSELDNMLQAKALYWRAETHYRLQRYASASKYYQEFLRTPGAFSQPQYKKVPYDLGYTYFKMKEYETAVSWFRKYVEDRKEDSLGLLTDALIRLGDCLYIQRKYWPSIDYYQKANLQGGIGADYALYQQGCVFGLVSRPEKKLEILKTLSDRYPSSVYRSNAYYEIAETYHFLERLVEAKEYYWKVVNEFPSSANAPSSLLQVGLICYEEDRYGEAIENLERVISDYAGTPSMHEAIAALERVYQAQGDVKPYLAYLERIGQSERVSVGRRDSLFYTTAESQYMGGQYNRARMSFEEYLREYPQGAASIAANYYLSDCLLRASDTASALPHLEVVISRQPNEFYERALYKALPVYEQHKEYTRALEGYDALERITSDAVVLQEARYGKLRMAVLSKDEEHIIEYANAVIADERIAPEKQLFAKYHLGMALLRAERYDQAYNTLAQIGSSTGSATGAEARYRMAEIRSIQGDWPKLQEEVFAFARKNTPHQYWLAKAFILLADGYKKEKDYFQARATLQSISVNYNEKEDGILAEVRTKLSQLTDEEKARERVVPSDTIQFDFAR